MAEPLLFLLSIGIGLSGLVGPIRVGDESVPYATFVAPALLAASSMNGAMIDSIFNVFFKLRITHSYESVLATPLDTGDVALGELTWAVVRGVFYAATFLVIMAALGDTQSWLIVFYPGEQHAAQRVLRRGGHGRHHLHAKLAGLRPRGLVLHPALPLLRDLLSGERLPAAGWPTSCG